MGDKLSVLLIDDNVRDCNAFVEAFRPYAAIAELTVANNRELATRMLKTYRQGYDLIILDACIDPPGISLDTLDLIAQLFDTSEVDAYNGLLVGATSVSDFQREMRRAGCQYAIDKERIRTHLSELLSLAKEQQLNAELDKRGKKKRS